MGVLLGLEMPMRRAPIVQAHCDNRFNRAIPVACRQLCRFAQVPVSLLAVKPSPGRREMFTTPVAGSMLSTEVAGTGRGCRS